MKKRIFGMLLMGAMVVASMSMFTSCKDYDDDINKNASDIAVLKTQLTTLQDALKTAQGDITTAKSAVDAAAAAAKKAQETADGATDAAKTNAASIKAANDEIEALKKLVAATAKAEDLEKVKSELETAIETATAGKVSAEELAETLKPISAKIDAIDESINTLTTDVKALQDWKKTVDGQIASVLADLESQKTVNANFQKALNDIKSDLGTLASEEAIKAYVADQIKNLASKSEVAAAIAEALKSYTTTADLKETLKGYSTPAAVSTAIANALEGYYTATKTDELISKLDEKLSGAIDDLKEAAQTEDQVKKIAQDAADKVSEELGEEINTLNVLVNKILTSITLIPQTYINGIEAIQFKSVQYTPQVFNGALIPAEYGNATAVKDGNYTSYEAVAAGLMGTIVENEATLEEFFASKWYLINPGSNRPFRSGMNTNPYQRPVRNVDIADHQLQAVTTAGEDDEDVVVVDPVTIDNGETEAYYRVSPAGINESQINKEGIKMVCTVANTQTRAAELTDNDPVSATFKSLENGVLTVNLKKKGSDLLRYNGENTGADDHIASLMVPRAADATSKQEAAEIYSEFNLIDEMVIEPRIAALNKVVTGSSVSYEFNPEVNPHDPYSPMMFHYIDSLHIFRSQVDHIWRDETGDATDYLYVKEGVKYNAEFDLLQLVTGCYKTSLRDYDNNENLNHFEITKDELKNYGIAFRFAIPETYATPDVINQNATNQQDFIKFTDEGDGQHIIKAKLPQGRTDNRAAIGKEPIIRVMLVDTVRHNLVDQAYFKVKFIDNEPKQDIQVEFTAEQTLKCDSNSMKVQWVDFIEKVYAQIGDEGLSWNQFRQIYPEYQVQRIRNPKYDEDAANADNFLKPVRFSKNPYKNETTEQFGIADGTYARTATEETTTNGFVELFFLSDKWQQASPLADANELTWNLGAADIQTIDKTTRSSEFETKIIFKSSDRSVYPNVVVTLKFTIKLPELPNLTFYENYWYDKYNAHYVLPVQYNTKAYYDQLIGKKANYLQYDPANGDFANPEWTDEQGTKAYCVYNNNLFNAFTFNQTEWYDKANGIYNAYYNTPITTIAGYNCANWDFQFRLEQANAGVGAMPQYAWTALQAEEDAEEPLTIPHALGQYTQSENYTRPTPYKVNSEGAVYGAYNLMTYTKKEDNADVYNDAIWMNWYNDVISDNPATDKPGTVLSEQKSWEWTTVGEDAESPRPYLFADHFNANNQVLINPITSNGIGKAPTFSNDKKVKMGMFIAWNTYNVELLYSYDICLVAPLDINADLKGYFEEGIASGSFVNCADAFTMVDFRGYEVAQAAPTDAQKKVEFQKYRDRLYNYYECTEPVFDLTKIKYGMKVDDSGNIVVDETVTIANINEKGLTTKQIYDYTNGNVALSIENINPDGEEDTQYLRFKNNGGSNVEDEVNVFIPATMTYGFGTITKYVQLKLYPRGGVPAAARRH